jgi:hypothetical protein
VLSAQAAVFTALAPGLHQLGIQWSPITRGHPWQNLAEGGFSIQRRMLDAYVVGCTARERVYHQHAQFVQDYQFWGHWAHKRRDTEGRVYYLSPEVMLGQATGQVIDPTYLRRVFRLRQLTRTVRQHGQIRLHNFGLYVERGLWGETVGVVWYDDMVRIEQAEQQVVSYPCIYDTRLRRITEVDASGRQQYLQVPAIQLVFFTLALARTVWCMPRYRRTHEARQALPAPQMSLLPPFADYIVQIRIEGWRIQHPSSRGGDQNPYPNGCHGV